MSQHVDGEEEQVAAIEPLHRAAMTELARWAQRPVNEAVIEMLRWLARESFRAGYRHAHERSTVSRELWPVDDEQEK
jgi:hypothetical protein